MSATAGAWGASPTIIPVPSATISDSGGRTITDTRGLFVIHAVVLHTGKVLWFCGHVEDAHYPLLSYVFDPANPGATLTPIPFPALNPAWAGGVPPVGHGGPSHADLFCSHYVQLPDGRVMLVGGSDPNFGDTGFPAAPAVGSQGAKYIFIFDPIANSGAGEWTYAMNGASMLELDQGRWYPTAVLLGDGSVLVASGRREQPAGVVPPGIADQTELLRASGVNWNKDNLGASVLLPIYPGLHLSPEPPNATRVARVYYTHTTWGQETASPANTLFMDVPTAAAPTATWQSAGIAPATTEREEGMSVLLPPANDGKVLLFGGSIAIDGAGNPVVQTGANIAGIHPNNDGRKAQVLNMLPAGSPSWETEFNLQEPRINGHAVILPDYTVLILGGHDTYKWTSTAGNFAGAGAGPLPTTPSNDCEIYDPASNTSRVVDALKQPRMYHSAAVLLPDGRVLAAGGADPNDVEPNVTYPTTPAPGWEGPKYTTIALNRKDYEIYQPPYLFYAGTRPTISSVSATQVYYDRSFTVETPQAAAITKVALMRPGAPTHHTDSEQRLVDMQFVRGGNELTVTVPNNSNLLPPGYYMLFILDEPNVSGTPRLRPSEAEWVQVTVAPPAPPAPSGSSKFCVVVTAAVGEPAPEVAFLTDLRAQLAAASPEGTRFVQAVNAVYYPVGTPLARRMTQDDALRRAVHTVLVKPAYRAIRAASRVADPQTRLGAAALMALLTAEAIIGLLLLPVLLPLVLAVKLAGGDDAG